MYVCPAIGQDHIATALCGFPATGNTAAGVINGCRATGDKSFLSFLYRVNKRPCFGGPFFAVKRNDQDIFVSQHSRRLYIKRTYFASRFFLSANSKKQGFKMLL